MHRSLTILLPVLLLQRIKAGDLAENCPRVCTCETAPLSNLPINSVLIKSQHHNKSEEQKHSYQNKNEVLDEVDEREAQHRLGEGELRAATCVLQPLHNLDLFLSLPPDLQVLTILQGPGAGNITLDERYFEHLQSLVVLEIHGYPQLHRTPTGESHLGLRVRNSALKQLDLLQYLNLQHVHLLGDKHRGNKPAPVSKTQYLENNGVPLTMQDMEDNNIIPPTVQLVQQQDTIVPYSVYREQQERAGLSTFANLKSLVFLRAFSCGIKEINWEMFEGLQQLEYLSLEGNKIPFLHEFSFYGTPNLKHLDLSHNKLLDLQSMDLAGLLKLETLDLSYNNISHLSEFSLPPFPSLISADFHHNPLEAVLPYTFQVLNSTRQLFLGGKKARLDIHPNSFSGLKKLHKVSINGVQLEVLEREYLKGMPNLREIRIEGTVNELSFDAFAEVPKLQELIMKNCSIRKISMDAFFGLYELIYLDLSHNELVTLPPALFDHQKSLKEINLGNNKLITLPEGIFAHTKAKLIRLDNNPWHCTCSMHEWQPSQINKKKERITDSSQCQTRYDKGSMCRIQHVYQYTYDQSVTPKCATPTRYNGWSVFHLLRKHLRCDKKIYKDKVTEGKTPKVNVEVYGNKDEISMNHTLHGPKDENNYTEKTQPPSSTRTRESTESAELQTKRQTQSSTPTYTEESQTIQQDIHHKPQVIGDLPDNQRMWTEENKKKYKLLLKKEKMLEGKLKSVEKDKKTPDNLKIHIDPISKTKKVSDIKKKWEMKMKNTMEKLNEVPKNEINVRSR